MEDALDVQRHSKYFFTISFIALIVLAIFLIKSFIITLVYSFVLAYIFYPVYKKIAYVLRSKNLAAFFSVCIIVLLIIIPLIFTANTLINESLQFFRQVKDIDLSTFDEKIKANFDINLELDEYIKDGLNKFSLAVAKATSDFLVSIPQRILHFFVMLFTIFYMLKEGKTLVTKFNEHIPLKESHRRDITAKFSNMVYASLYGLVVTAFIQGVLGAIGFWIFDVPSPILWGLVTVILAMIPFIGAWVVWLPASLFKIFSGDLFNGIGLLIYGMLIVSTIDNIVRPKIIGSKAKIHPVVVLLGVLGGIQVFGLLGIIIGPLILSIMELFFDLYIGDKTNKA